ncbi:MAG: nucleoside hydrolase [Actinomycetota bacterium]
MDPIPVILDTDGGVDDCAALWFGLTSPAIEIVAITCVAGNVNAAQAARNVAKVLKAAGRSDIPFSIGADQPLGPGPAIPGDLPVHGSDGLGDAGIPDAALDPTTEPAIELILRLVDARPGELTLVAVGPFTNVALALRSEPSLAGRVRDLVVMGGAAQMPGNVTATSEFNVAKDPTAAAETVAASWPRPPTMVGLDATHQATMGARELDLVAERRTPAAAFMADPLRTYHRIQSMVSEDGTVPCHDALALMAVAHPELLITEVLPVNVDTGGGAAWGMTVVDFRARSLASGSIPADLLGLAQEAFFAGKHPWRVALGADVDGFRARLNELFGR